MMFLRLALVLLLPACICAENIAAKNPLFIEKSTAPFGSCETLTCTSVTVDNDNYDFQCELKYTTGEGKQTKEYYLKQKGDAKDVGDGNSETNFDMMDENGNDTGEKLNWKALGGVVILYREKDGKETGKACGIYDDHKPTDAQQKDLDKYCNDDDYKPIQWD